MDNFFKNWFQRREISTQTGASTPGVPASTAEGDGNKNQKTDTIGASFEARIQYARSPFASLTISAVYRATELRMKTLAVMPIQYRKRDVAGGNLVEDRRGLGKRINYLLQVEPNPIMTATSLWELVTYNQMMTGNGFVYIERDEFDFPLHLWFVKAGEYNRATGTYAFIQYLSETGYVEKVNVPRSDVMHFPNTYRYPDGFWGMPTIAFALEAMSLNKTLKGQALETAAKGGRVKGFIGEEKPSSGQGTLAYGLYNQDEGDKYAKEIQQKIYSGQDIIAIRGLDKFQSLSMTSADMQAMEQLGMTYDDVARFWATPRPLLMLDTNSHYNDYQNATMEYHTRTILPEKNDREKEIFRKLIGFRDFGTRDIHICEKPLLSMDPERQAKVDEMHLQTGWSINEIRAEHDLPSVEGGDRIFRTANVKGLDEMDGSTILKPGNYTVGEPTKEGENGEQAQQ